MAEVTSGRFVLGIKIEGVGDVTASTATDKRTRFVTGRDFLDSPGVSDPDELYEDGLLYWPSEIGSSIDFISGRSTLSTHTFSLQMTDNLRSTLFRYKHTPFLAEHVTPGGVNATATAMTLSKSGIANDTVIYLRREAIRLVSSVGYDYVVERGVLGTQAVPHGVQPRDNVECYTTLRVLEARQIELFRVDMAAPAIGAYDETLIWSGIVRRVYATGPQELTLDADSVLGLLSLSKLMRNQWEGKVETWDESDQGTAIVSIKAKSREVPSRNHIIDAISTGPESPALIQIKGEGAGVFAKAGRQDYRPYWVDDVYATEIRDVARLGLAPELIVGTEISPGTECYEILSSSRQQPAGNGLDPSDIHNLPLASNPAVLLLQILLSRKSEILNDSAQPVITPQVNHPTYDTGLGNIAANIPASLVDVDAIEAWGTRYFGDMAKFKDSEGLDCFHLGIDGKTESTLSVVERILRPYSCVLTTGRTGKLRVVTIADAISIGATNTITQADIITPPAPGQDRMLESSVETIQSKYNLWPEFGGDSLEFRDMFNRDLLPDGWGDSPELDVPIQSEPVVRALLERIINRFHLPIPVISIETLRTADFYPGDVVSVTHEHLFGNDGTKGLTDAACLVASRTEVLGDEGHTIRYELLYVGFIYNRVGYIAPSAKITGYATGAGGTSTLTLLVNAFTDAAQGPFARDCPDDVDSSQPWQVGDEVQIVDQYGTVVHAGVTISFVADDEITLDVQPVPAPTTTAGQEDIVRVASYDSSVATQKATWAFVADNVNTLGAANDDPYEYTSDEQTD